MSNYKEYFLPKGIGIIFLFFAYSSVVSCTQKIYIQPVNYDFKSKNDMPDFADLDYWAASPFKEDPSDEVPKDLNPEKDTLADVFFIYPTSYTDLKMPDGWNADIDDPKINAKTDKESMLYQASIFNKYCRVFAPRYRQANLEAFYTKNKEKADAALDTAYQDVKNAFEYYLQHYNNGRPIIIASHSQGTWHAGRLLKEFFEGKPLMKQFVCAYIVGLPVFTNYFSELKPCEDSTSNGCFVSWRTFREGYEPSYVKQEKQKAFVVNPLTWTTDTSLAPASLNKGGVLRNFNKVIPGLVHAQIHGNVLWVNKPKFFGSIFLKTKNYHIADYNLFYENVRENVGTRIRSFLQNKSASTTVNQ